MRMQHFMFVFLGITLFLLLSGVSKAQSLGNFIQDLENGVVSPLCNDMLSSAPNLGSSYSALLGISLLIVLLVLVVLGIIYAIGRAFGIPTLMEFVKKEYIESIFNILLIVIIVGGIGVIDGSVSFLSNLAIVSVSPGSTTAASISSTRGLYSTLCTTYLTNGINRGLSNIFYLLAPNIIDLSILQNFQVAIGNSGLFSITGVEYSYSPFAGIYPYVKIIGTENAIVYALLAIYIGMSFLLGIIYSIFPLLLYVGILLRSFPWTRAAGGSLVALFISFFIVFPSILYAFSILQTNTISTLQSIVPTLSLSSVSTNIVSVLESIFAGVNITSIMTEIADFANFFAYGALQLLGLVIAFLISFDLLEGLGDLLGAPSLESKGLLKKVI
ncbi:MAG: hypothetical protein QW478_03215 [Candidatus Micrarchaeaceae archaeon]